MFPHPECTKQTRTTQQNNSIQSNSIQNNNVNTVSIKQFDSSGVGVDTITAASIEIRVYS
jgi:hypothetical protein